MIRTYSDLSKFETFNERFEYLKLNGKVGRETFGVDRYLNQILYNSREWRRTRNLVLIRDYGCDLGIEGFELNSGIIIHHMNSITVEQVLNRDPYIFDPEYLITTSINTHNAIHYGDENQLSKVCLERKPGDTKLW